MADSMILNSILLYGVVMGIIIFNKPKSMFVTCSDGKCRIKKFGTGRKKTLMTFQITSIITAVLVYMIVFILVKLL